MSPESSEKKRKIMLGNKRALGYHHTEEAKRRIAQTSLGRKRESLKGEFSANWRGGVTPINQIIRTSKEYKLWRKAVFERDNYTCQKCDTKGGVLNADHIKRFSQYPELRFSLENGRTLCIDCHKKTDNYSMRGCKAPWNYKRTRNKYGQYTN